MVLCGPDCFAVKTPTVVGPLHSLSLGVWFQATLSGTGALSWALE
jgi:hypothetical protein